MDTRPRADERADLAGHPVYVAAGEEHTLLAAVRRRYPDWIIGPAETGGYAATHRTEEPDERTRRAGVEVTVTAEHLDQLERTLFWQQALRGEGADAR